MTPLEKAIYASGLSPTKVAKLAKISHDDLRRYALIGGCPETVRKAISNALKVRAGDLL